MMRASFLALCGLTLLAPRLVAQDAVPPTIKTQPVNVTVYVGEPAALTAILEGSAPIVVQWYKNSVAIPGATSSTYSVTAAQLGDFGLYHLVATNAFGSANTAPALLNVTKRPQTITFAPASMVIPAGSGLTLAATSSAGLPITFTLVSGAASLSGNLLTGQGGPVVVRATQPGNDTVAAAEPVENTFNFLSGIVSPFITSPPADQTVTAGLPATFRAGAIGTPVPTFQWHKDGVPVAGATNATLTIAGTTLADAGRYTVVASNAAGEASASATLTVRAPPVIVAGPISRTVAEGESATFSVVSTGVPTPTYQWRRNGVNLSAATNSTLTLRGVTTADSGRYDAIVANPLGSVTSSAATLTVNARDLAGIYFGRFGADGGDFALLVRGDRSVAFVGHLPAIQTGIVVLNGRVDPSGDFTLTTATFAGAGATSRPVNVRGNIADNTGSVSGTVAELSTTFSGTRSSRTGSSSALSGLYAAAVIGSASGRGFFVVAPDGEVLLLLLSGATIESARATLDSIGHLALATASRGTLELTFGSTGVSGVARAPTGESARIVGVIEAQSGTEHLVNLSIRTLTSPGAATLISGFVLNGTASKQVLIRVAGPALSAPPFNIGNAISDPTLQLFRGSALIGQNDDWGTPAASVAALTAAMTRAGAFPFRVGSQDAALLTTLAPGAYSVVVGGGTGTALAEVYEVLENNEVAGTKRLVNLSARGLVSPNAPFITGFVITGAGPQRVLVRAVGPALAGPPFNVAGALPNPLLTLFRGNAVVKANDDWFRDPEAALVREAATRAGAFPLGANSADAAMLIYLEPGAYTAQITGAAANPTGLALIEVYEANP